MSDPSSINQDFIEQAKLCVESAPKLFGVILDYSEDSLGKVDEILSKLHAIMPSRVRSQLDADGPLPESVDRICIAFGAYIAEVIRRHWGGQWTTEYPLYPGQQMPTFEVNGGIKACPQMKVLKWLQHGPGESIGAYYQLLKLLKQKHASQESDAQDGAEKSGSSGET